MNTQSIQAQKAFAKTQATIARATAEAYEELETELATLGTNSDDGDESENENTTSVRKNPKAAQGGSKKAAAVDEDDDFGDSDDSDDVDADEEISDEAIKKAFAAYAKRNGVDKAKSVLKKFKVKGSADLTQEQRVKAMDIIG